MNQSPSRPEHSRRAQSEQPDTLIRSKLYIPQVRPNLVPRPRLVERLTEGFTRPLTLIAAPAGFGKTTLLSELIASAGAGLPVAWVSLDERDNEPARFGTYFLAALVTLEIGVGENLLARLGSRQPPPLEAVFTELVNQIAEVPDDFALVLDDYHLITAEPVHAALTFLLNHQPSQMHLVIASRVDPPLPLAQLRARSQLTELRAGELRFTTEEAAAFLNRSMGLNLPAEAIAALDARTEGWIAGLQLAALSMRDRADRLSFIRAFTGSHRYIVDYLAEQVLQQQPANVQTFLWETSILDRLSGPLCDAVTGQPQSQQMLEDLERANLFLLPLDDDRHWYRYHRLFADFLRERLRQTRPERWPELHHRAAEWYERNGFLAEAVGHALAVGETEQAARLVEQMAESIWMRGEMMRLLGWLEALPDDLIRSRPRLCIFHAWILNILGHYESAQERLRDGERSLEQATGVAAEERGVIRGMLATVWAIIAMMEGDAARALELSCQAWGDFPETNLVWRSVITRNLGNVHLLTGDVGMAHQALTEAMGMSQRADNIYMTMVILYELAELQIIRGRLRNAAQICQDALQLAAERGSAGLAMPGALHVGLAEVLREWNDLEAGRREVLAGIEYGQQGRSLGVQVCGYTRLGMLAQARGDAGGAAQAFQKAVQLASTRRRTSFLPHHDVQARLWWRQGDVDAAWRWTQARGLSADDEPSYMNETAHLTLARVLLARNRPDEAVRLLVRLRSAAEAAGRIGRVIEILAVLALALQARGETGQALAALEQALALAEPEGFVRVFVDEGEAMRNVIRDWRLEIRRQKRDGGEEKLNRLLVYADRLLAAFPDQRPQLPVTNYPSPISTLQSLLLVEPLSEREIEVLRFIAAGMSNQDIAQKLVVALSTVQWHIKNIYGKLSVHSRTQAVARARDLGLLA